MKDLTHVFILNIYIILYYFSDSYLLVMVKEWVS